MFIKERLWWECKGKPLWMSVWRFLRKLGNNLPQDPVIPHIGCISKGCSIVLQGHVLNYVHSSIICHGQNLETTQIPLDQRMEKENVVHLHNGELHSK